MAEPFVRGTVPMCVAREFSASRLEKQLWVKVYDLLIPVAQASCPLPPVPAEKVRSGHLIGSIPHTKGV
jgi:hypothetical protein